MKRPLFLQEKIFLIIKRKEHGNNVSQQVSKGKLNYCWMQEGGWQQLNVLIKSKRRNKIDSRRKKIRVDKWKIARNRELFRKEWK